MPKSNLDWLGVVSLWIGAVIMAFKAANAPLMRGAPDWLAANVWTYVPLVLVTFYLLIAIYRQLVPLIEPKTMVPREAIKRSTDESRIDVPFEASSVLPKRVSEEYIELLAQGCTNMQETRFLRLYVETI